MTRPRAVRRVAGAVSVACVLVLGTAAVSAAIRPPRLAYEIATLPNGNTIVSPIDFVRLPVYFEALTLMYRVTTRSAA